MPLSKDKKILIYLLLFFFLGTINNKYIVEAQIFEIKNFKLEGLNKKEELNLLIQLGQIKNQNIFLLPKKKLVKILNSNNLIESFKINKNYPSNLNISIKKTSFIANVISDEENFIIGANKKLIRSDSIDPSLPMVIGNASVEDFFSTFITFSSKNLSNKSSEFLPSVFFWIRVSFSKIFLSISSKTLKDNLSKPI